MKFTELSDYRLPAGTVTEWAPYTVAPESEWVVDLRPATFDHEMHLRRSAEYQAGNSWLGAVFEIDRPFDGAAFETALYLWTAHHEVLRSTVSLKYFPGDRAVGCRPDGITRRYTHPAGAIGIHGRVTGAMTGDAITAHLTSTFDAELSPLTWPHHRAVTITDLDPDFGGQERFVAVLAADHCVVDAYSLLVAIGELRAFYLAEVDGTQPRSSCAGSHLDYGIHDRKAGAELTPVHPAVTHWRTFLAASGWRFPDSGLTSAQPVTSHDAPGSCGGSEFVLSAREADEVNRICREAGHSMQTTVFTALALAHRAVTGEPRMRAAMPMHTRFEPRYVDAIGWFVGLGPLDVDVRAAESFRRAMDLTTGAIGAAKAVSRYPYPRIAQLTGCEAIPEFVISYLDVRYVPGAADWARLKAQTLRGRTESDREVYLWVARTPDGITVSTRHPGTAAAAAAVRDFVDTAVEILSRVGTEGVDAPLEGVVAAQLPA